ncbi:16S rRNA (cytidine1402-2'-O)-methyltransferase [Salirhabdus euzebyi]|uniref:Ribosomal RNA small subunit methyltransferase I n=1 Tax=Salirhabdus euzebyi TaxID=394506 RepID=A0A841Q981_9BACI|nr:16S rRNA (cytidine(1402)-2'-O)-methyltransferase [Salirhabdus euzebyi]MBB6455229.1 16S rRNA (cytidine1402-2'-O)-methyltransferase [Salirhabdus euzebyi]
MQIQKSFENEEKGKLYIVPTPIGNLEDITFRALNILKEVDVIAAEDTRQTKKLLNHFEITTPTISYHEHNKSTMGEKLLSQLEAGKKLALVSDAGMPVISDPGFDLIQKAYEKVDIIVLPGANAALCALVGSGLPAEQFYFYGFLPRKKKELKLTLQELQYIKATLIFYESPHRIKETIKGIADTLGAERRIAIGRELTKRYEEYIRGSAKEVSDWLQTEEAEIRGEFCIILEGSSVEKVNEEEWFDEMSILEHIEYYVEEKGLSNKEAIKQVALDRKLPKREVYNVYHK